MEEDKPYGYDGPDSRREPLDEGLAAVEEPAAEEANDRYDAQNSGIGQDYNEMNGYPDTGSRQYEGWGKDEYPQAANPAYIPPQRQSSMALASLIMGIIGIVTSCCCYGGMIFGSLGIVFALLSKTEDTMEGYAKAGLITSIIALVLAFMAMIFLFGMMSFSLLSGGAY